MLGPLEFLGQAIKGCLAFIVLAPLTVLFALWLYCR